MQYSNWQKQVVIQFSITLMQYFEVPNENNVGQAGRQQ